MPEEPSPMLPAFVGRQPIFDARQAVRAYELLFRVGHDGAVAGAAGESLTAEVVINAFVEIGLDQIVGPHPAFLNVTRAFLVDGFAHDLPADRVVIEVLETVPADDAVLSELRALRAAGFRVALDDFVPGGQADALLELADTVKLDVEALGRDAVARHVRALRGPRTLVAERLETAADFEWARSLGFDLFQGFFLARPSVVSRQRPPASRLATLRVLALLDDPNVSYDALEEAISCDVLLAFKVLRIINSAAFGLPRRVDSLKQALVLLGQRRLHTWVALTVLAGLSDKPVELLTTALIRARMCERLGHAQDPERDHTYFTVGLLSALDAMLDATMDDVVASVALAPDVAGALVRHEGPLGRTLATTLAYEACDWDGVFAAGGHYAPNLLRRAYLDALGWAASVTALREAA